MLINASKRFAFIHVPKTGGMSITAALRDHCDQFTPWGEAVRSPALVHITGRRLAGLIGPEWPEWNSFAIVRDPWCRMASLWGYSRKNAHREPWVKFADMAMGEFVCGLGHTVPYWSQAHYTEGVKHLYPFPDLGAALAHMAECLGIPCPELPWENKSEHGECPTRVPERVRSIINTDEALWKRVLG